MVKKIINNKEEYKIYILYEEKLIKEYIEIKFDNFVYTEAPNNLALKYKEINIDFNLKGSNKEHIYLLVVRYKIINIYGKWAIIGGYKKSQDAIKIKKNIENKEYKEDKPWGQFENIENIEIYALHI